MILPLTPSLKNYDWGKIGSQSLAGKLSGLSLEEKTPYAELWFGAHPSNSSTVQVDGMTISLADLISRSGDVFLGESCKKRFGSKLPFLLKVLSIDKPLSIQAHPDKGLAAKLHSMSPEHYPDDNHKPEIAMALSEAELLYGFRRPEEFAALAEERPPLKSLVVDGLTEDLQRSWLKLVALSPSEREKLVKDLVSLVGALDKKTPEDRWFENASKEFSHSDPGLLAFYLLSPVSYTHLTLPTILLV